MVEPVAPDRQLRELLLTKVYNGNASELDADIRTQRGSGSTNDYSAMKKLVRTRGTRELPEAVSCTGYFLQLYQRKPRQGSDEERGYSAYLINADGENGQQAIQTVHFDKPTDVPDPRKLNLTMGLGEPQTWANLHQKTSLISGAKWLTAARGATLAKASADDIGKSLWSLARPVTRITDGFGVWNGYVSGVFQVGEFDDDNEKTGNAAILGDGGEANLAVGLTDQIDPKTGRTEKRVTTVKVKTQAQLQTLLGDSYDEALLLSDKAIGELKDVLNGTPVIIFGKGLTPNADGLKAEIKKKMKNPTVNLSGGLGLIAPYIPDSTPQ